MKRLTTNDTNHILALLNLFYAEDNEVMVRGGDPEPDYADTTLVELIRRIANTHNLTTPTWARMWTTVPPTPRS